MTNSLNKPREYIALIIGVLIGLLRPTVFGEIYSLPICIFISSLLVLFILIGGVHYKKLDYLFFIQIMILFFIALYIFFRRGSEPYRDLGIEIKGFFLTLSVVFSLLILSQNVKYLIKLFDGVFFVVLFCCLTISISGIIYIMGFSTENMIVGYIPYTYQGRGDIVLPFTFIYNTVDTIFGVVPRLSGIYREPGIVPAFASWAIAYVYWRNWNFLYIFVLFFGSMVSFSSIGFVVFYPVAAIILLNLNLRPMSVFLIITLILLVTWPTLYLADIGGIHTKSLNGSGSFDERYEQFMAFFDTREFIFGDGTNWSPYNTGDINVLAGARGLGLIYLIPLLAVIFIPIRNQYMFFVGLVPCIFVVFTSQPIVLSEAFVVLWFSWVVMYNGNAGGRRVRSQ